MAQLAPRTEAGAMDLPGLAAERSEGNGLGPLDGLTCSAEPSRTATSDSFTESRPASNGLGTLDDCERRVRDAVARELHDRVAQPLTALLLGLEELKRDPGDRRRQHRRIDSVQDQVRTALFGLRQVLCELREQEWLDTGLAGRIRGELETLLSLHPHLQLRLVVSPRWPGAVRSRVGDHVLQIVREAVHNARFHGGGTCIDVALRVSGSRAEIVVTDDGRGLEGRRVRLGMGLLGIHERATLLGGRVVVGDRPGGGTRLRVTVPREVLG